MLGRDRILSSFSLALSLAIAGCGAAAVDHAPTLSRLRDAIHAEISTPTQLEDHNQLVERVVNDGMLEGLRQHEVRERIGHGEECGIRSLCSEHGFRGSDWAYDVGRQPGDPDLGAGPTLIVGFDSSGIVDRTYYVTRR